ncbi:MAG: HPr-rel-A system PqqD family peptide chaperone [Janthinobacterium lividum]
MWDDDSAGVMYDTGTGDTHFLDAMAMEVLRLLSLTARSSSALAAAVATETMAAQAPAGDNIADAAMARKLRESASEAIPASPLDPSIKPGGTAAGFSDASSTQASPDGALPDDVFPDEFSPPDSNTMLAAQQLALVNGAIERLIDCGLVAGRPQ